MTEIQKKAIMGMVVRMLVSFNLPREEYLERKKEIFDWLYGREEK